MKKNRDFRIRRAKAQNLGDDDFIWAVVESFWPDNDIEIGNERKHLVQGTPGQQAIYATLLFIREVCNGGLEQFFYNSSGNLWDFVIKGFELLGADVHSKTFKKSLTIFPKSKVPIDREKRIDLLEKIDPEKLKSIFDPLNETFYALGGEEGLYSYHIKYIRLHPKEFFID